MVRMFGFNAPHERMEPKFWKAALSYDNANVGRFLRNTVLDGMTYGMSDLIPSYLKTCDLVHPLCGSYNSVNEPLGVYGGVTASAGVPSVLFIIQHERTDAVWTPGGNGMGAWFAVKLPENGLADRYLVESKASVCPLSWTLQGSLDGTAWTDLHVVENTGVWTAGNEQKTFTIPEASRGNYLWYKLIITGSNVTTLSLYRFRLLRPENICPRGSILVDASVSNPLTLSFTDGFDGSTPINHIESLTSPQIIPIADDIIPSSGGSFDLYAVRSPSGGVTIEPVYYGGAETEILSGGMQDYTDRGFQATPASNLGYKWWGRLQVTSPYSVTGEYGLRKIDGSPFYISRAYFGRFGTDYTWYIDLDTGGGYVRFATATTTTLNNYSLPVGLAVYGVQCKFSTGSNLGVRLFTAGSKYRHRMVGGVLYQWDNNDAGAAWTPVQKIKLATVRQVSGLADVANVIPKATALSMWQIDGDATQTLIEG